MEPIQQPPFSAKKILVDKVGTIIVAFLIAAFSFGFGYVSDIAADLHKHEQEVGHPIAVERQARVEDQIADWREQNNENYRALQQEMKENRELIYEILRQTAPKK